MQIKPILTPDVEEALLNAVTQYQHRDKWIQWGMEDVRKQGSAILLIGETGTGKTTAAKWLAKKIQHGIKILNAATVSSGDTGESEKNIFSFFAEFKKRNNMTIFIDECDHMLMNRDTMEGAALTWQLGSVEAIMTSMNDYKGLIICATNHAQNLDPALTSRFLAIIHIGKPDLERRKLLWKQKIPDQFPFQPTEYELAMIAKFKLTGREIENVLVNVANSAIRDGVKPSMKRFIHFCKAEITKKLKETR